MRGRFREAGFRAVPGAIVRRSAYVAPGVVLMPSFVNVGAYVGSGTMVDTWATVGSCAQIGKNCHLSGGVGIGGVLEPVQAEPVIVEDNCFIGARSEVVEGVIVETGAVLAMGVFIGASTKIVDRATGRDLSRPRSRLFRRRAGEPAGRAAAATARRRRASACAVIVKRSTSAPAPRPRSTSCCATDAGRPTEPAARSGRTRRRAHPPPQRDAQGRRRHPAISRGVLEELGFACHIEEFAEPGTDAGAQSLCASRHGGRGISASPAIPMSCRRATPPPGASIPSRGEIERRPLYGRGAADMKGAIACFAAAAARFLAERGAISTARSASSSPATRKASRSTARKKLLGLARGARRAARCLRRRRADQRRSARATW